MSSQMTNSSLSLQAVRSKMWRTMTADDILFSLPSFPKEPVDRSEAGSEERVEEESRVDRSEVKAKKVDEGRGHALN